MVHETDDKYLAAVVNAGADHYLLDLLAPGHVYVRRADVTDASALSAHDLANRKGGNFHIANDPDNRANSGFHELRVFVCNEIRDELVRSENIRFRNRNIEKWNMKGVFASNEEIGAACT